MKKTIGYRCCCHGTLVLSYLRAKNLSNEPNNSPTRCTVLTHISYPGHKVYYPKISGPELVQRSHLDDATSTCTTNSSR